MPDVAGAEEGEGFSSEVRVFETPCHEVEVEREEIVLFEEGEDLGGLAVLADVFP